MDLKGFQYDGTIHAGPTVLIGSIVPNTDEKIIKVESITDEFCSIKNTGDVMAQFDAVVEGDMDDGYQMQEENVNTKKSKESLVEAEVEDSKGTKNQLKRRMKQNKQSSTNSSKKKKRSSKT